MQANNYKTNASPVRQAIFLFFLVQSLVSSAQQINVTANGFSYQQNFNSLTSSGAWSNGNTLNGWYAASQESGSYNLFTTSAGGTDNHGLYSFGSNSSVNGAGDRALGSINQDASGDIVYGVLFKNTSGLTMNSVSVSLRAEQWRRVISNKKGYQRVKLSYRVNNSISTSASGLFSNEFLDLQEGNLIELDTTKINESMDGNAEGNFATITVEFPVTIPNNHKFFLRFRDENSYSVDAALALDDLEVEFSTTSVDHIATTSSYDFHAYLDQAVLTDIPGDSPQNIYTVPNANQLSDWTEIFSDFFQGNIHNDLATYGYKWVEFTSSASGKIYQVIRKNNEAQHYWGTYARLVAPTNSVLTIQAPHPLKDAGTEKQAASVFELSGASVLMVAGTDRCNSTSLTSCAGTTDICNVNNQKFRRSDVAHDIEAIFHVATMILAARETDMKFVQLHGFGQGQNDPEFIVSAGVKDHAYKSGIDYPWLFKIALTGSSLPDKDIRITHLDNYSQLAALDNVQGRFLNNYQGGNICADTIDPAKVTNRFLHIEQYKAVRDNPGFYAEMATIIGNVVNASNENKSYVEIIDADSNYQQNFDGLSAVNSTAMWMNDYTLNGWHATRSANAPLIDYRIGTGSSTNYGIYSFGSAQSSDRALGSLNQDDSQHIVYGVLFKNTSGETIRSINLTYRAEQWRVATTAAQQRVKLSYAISSSIDPISSWILNNSNFTTFQSGDLVTIHTGAQSSQSVNGNQNGNYVNIDIDIPMTLVNGDELFIRFFDDNATSVDHAMALDDFVITFSTNQLMPVQLGYFNVEKTAEDQALLTWKTLYEENSKSFLLDHSDEELEWKNVIEVNSAGDTKESQSYSWLHSKPAEGKNYYRLRRIDLDGKEQVLGIVAMQLKGDNESLNLSIYPNPATKEFTIESETPISKATLHVWDKSLGRSFERVDFSEFGRRQTVDVQTLPKGYYVVELRTRTKRQVVPLLIAK